MNTRKTWKSISQASAHAACVCMIRPCDASPLQDTEVSSANPKKNKLTISLPKPNKAVEERRPKKDATILIASVVLLSTAQDTRACTLAMLALAIVLPRFSLIFHCHSIKSGSSSPRENIFYNQILLFKESSIEGHKVALREHSISRTDLCDGAQHVRYSQC